MLATVFVSIAELAGLEGWRRFSYDKWMRKMPKLASTAEFLVCGRPNGRPTGVMQRA